MFEVLDDFCEVFYVRADMRQQLFHFIVYHVENTASRLLVVLTTGRSEKGDLCTFGRP